MKKQLFVVIILLLTLITTGCSGGSPSPIENEIIPKVNFNGALKVIVAQVKEDGDSREVIIISSNEKSIFVEPFQYTESEGYELVVGPLVKIGPNEQAKLKLKFNNDQWVFFRTFNEEGTYLGEITFYSKDLPSWYPDAHNTQSDSEPFNVTVGSRLD